MTYTTIAIEAKYLPLTNFKGGRYAVRSWKFGRKVVSENHSGTASDTQYEAVNQYLRENAKGWVVGAIDRVPAPRSGGSEWTYLAKIREDH